jgi:hypothetical protein
VNENAPYRVAPSYGLEKCPHCGGLTAAQPDKELRWVCGACGGPIVPGVDAAMLSDEGVRGLRRAALGAAAARKLPVGEIIAPIACVSLCYFTLGRPVAMILSLVFTLFAIGGYASRREKRLANARLEVEGAWLRAAEILVGARAGYLSAKELAATTRIPVRDAEDILTRLSVDRGRVDIDADQQLHYRVDASEPLDSDPPDAHDASSRRT